MIKLKENASFGEDNRYRLIRLLGRGGFSEVWLSEDTQTGLTVALKVYAPGRGLDEDGVSQFSNEFSMVFNLNHSNLLRPTHYAVFERMPYLIMPYCEYGSSLKQAGQFSEEKAWKFLHDVASGLAYLHAQEPPVIHQDIKPDNILVDGNGSFLITDFGISAKARSTLRQSMQSGGSGAGTMAYMGPERFGKDNLPIKAGDVWALGASLFELMTGEPPFGEHGGLLLKGGAEIPSISGEWSSKLKKIVYRCLQKDPWNRPTAQDISEQAKRHLNQESGPKQKSVKTKLFAVLAAVMILGFCVWLFRGYIMPRPALKECIVRIEKGDELAEKEETWKDAMIEYQAAKDMKNKHRLQLPDLDVEYRVMNLQRKIDDQFNNYVRRADNFLKDGLINQAIFYLEKALILKDDESIREKLGQLKK